MADSESLETLCQELTAQGLTNCVELQEDKLRVVIRNGSDYRAADIVSRFLGVEPESLAPHLRWRTPRWQALMTKGDDVILAVVPT